MKQDLILRQSTPQLSSLQLREWQRYRGWKLRILENLEHSGGMTTREISSRIGYPCHSTTNRLCEMQRGGVVEKVERWGWRITSNGIFLLSLNYTTTTTQQQHNLTTTTTQLEKEESAPKCFRAKTCHIKQICKDKRYTVKTRQLCHGTASCIWGASGADRAPVEMQVVGSTG